MFINGNVINNVKIKALLYSKDEFEIYRTITNGNLLIVKVSLYNKWKNDNLFFTVDPFKKNLIGKEEFYYLKSNKNFQLNVVEMGGLTNTRQNALNFVFALKQIRKLTNISLCDGIYIEEFGYVLPTYSDKELSDDALLGYYFSGNQNKHFSEGNFKSLFLSENDFNEISKLIGIPIEKIENEPEKKESISYDKRFTLTGRPELEKFFNEHIIDILNEPERYKKTWYRLPIINHIIWTTRMRENLCS